MMLPTEVKRNEGGWGLGHPNLTNKRTRTTSELKGCAARARGRTGKLASQQGGQATQSWSTSGGGDTDDRNNEPHDTVRS